MADIRNINNANAEPIQESVQQVGELAKAYKDAGVAEKEIVDLSKQLQNSLKNIVESMVLRNNEGRTSKAIAKELKNLEASREKENRNQLSLAAKLTAEFRTQLQIKVNSYLSIREQNREQLAAQQKLSDSEETLINLQNEKDTKRTNQLAASIAGRTDIVNALQTEINLLNNAMSIERQQAKGFKDTIKDTNEIIKKEQKRLDLSTERTDSLRNTIKANNSIKSQLDDEIQQLKKVQSLTLAKEKVESFTNFFKNKWIALLGVLALKNLIQTLFEADKQVVNLAEGLGISRQAAQGIRSEFTKFTQTVKDGSLSVTDMFEAQANMSKELGLSVKYSNQELKIFNDLTKLIGISVQSASKLNILSASTGIEYEKYVQNILEGAFTSEKQLDIQMSSRDILEEVGKLSAGILIKFQGNPEALGRAVIEAKKLGSSLEQIDKTGESLLNWESSIESTLKAELLTGKQLNLERARAAALTGDQADLMKEISSQVGSTKDFMKLNVIAQKSLAEAFGLSKDELAEMLMKQDLVRKYGKEAADLTKQQTEEFKNSGKSLGQFLEDQSKQLELQQKFNNSIDKLKQMFVTIAQGPFGTLVEMMVKLLNNATALKITFGVIAGIMGVKMYSSLMGLVTQMGILAALSAREATASIVSTSFKTLGWGAVAGTIAAGASIIYMNSQLDKSQKVPDGIAPSSNGPFTITDRYGSTAVTTNGDGIAVSPNISKNSQSSNRALEEKLDRLISINQQQYEVAKSGNVIQINEFALGKAAPIATYKENSRNFY